MQTNGSQREVRIAHYTLVDEIHSVNNGAESVLHLGPKMGVDTF